TSGASRLQTKIIVPNETGDGESKVADGRFLPVSLMSAPSGTELALCAHPEAEMCVGRNESFPISPAAPQAANPTAINITKAIHHDVRALPTFSGVASPPPHNSQSFEQPCQPTPDPTASRRQTRVAYVTYSRPVLLVSVSTENPQEPRRLRLHHRGDGPVLPYVPARSRTAARRRHGSPSSATAGASGIVWPYRLMKSKKERHQLVGPSRARMRSVSEKERALERAKAGRSPSNRSRSRSLSSSRSSDLSDDETAAKAIALLSHSSSVKLTEAGRAFARLPLDCMDISN
ncbi:uncharacterized protein PITG_22446, partial [Phytophthora infestans T30-4]